MPKKKILLNAFNMNAVGHINHGLWTHPRDRSAHYTDLDYWTSLAQTLERGKFDGIFLADIVGVYDVYQGGPDTPLREAVQIPINDPSLIVPAMAHVTRHIGFGVTSNLTYEPPYLFARRMSTLDHLTKGRVGWNIVTGYLDSAARGMGLAQQISHDDRYDRADDYMDVVYKLWEQSWEDDAVVRDRAARIFSQPGKVHRVKHDGPFYSIDAIHLSEPSPQRTPVLYQAGSSSRGVDFAARHAECVFVGGQNKQLTRSIVDDIRARAVSFGRSPDDIKIFAGITVVVGETERAAQEKFEEYRRYASAEGGIAHFSSSTGIDFSQYELDEPISYVKTQSMQSAVEAISKKSVSGVWTKRKVLEQMTLGGRAKPVVGSSQQIADELVSWIDEAGVDGFNLTRTVMPESFEDFVDLVVPELQNRGVYKEDYDPAPTLREKLFGGGRARLPDVHAGAQHRRAPQSGIKQTVEA
ncbi:MAG: Coenzyme F420-dependent N5,N10-methylene tetrahydromethanopterin reductase and related flavin-dependent oxidoreductases [uncultured Paraburkholderia sp.]|uniref:LLM class flavin-dependent oxidoreductase n=1 Tax=uncultured Paraburkholderia sp. TaxID=1822466 RepID=UPI002594E699|nr:LLM class flavin-dependent oxidoreductase [uncultured Paraburkholderia sp.]CAH2895722.1 MAG: Coenzyme F420-dependent N5,N10-methylene tetrahydromethanopterin reductase and related flavin-dependent oxidoreductases [uncultured Paraburkholderia sp.]CAH2931011.1 MAG: Coenzyme F420-dependent N5,N10-methylene tetrahydromethanopterin reductase and related flavin-dependent oxidoreductases [uncultured Paraburkholderia sp.]